MSLPPWQRSFDESSATLTVIDDRGALRAVVRLQPPPDPTDATVPELLQKVSRRLHRSVREAAQRGWMQRRGALSDGDTASLDLPNGSSGSVQNGRGSGLRRVHRTGTIALGDRTYTLRHRSRRRARLTREGLDLGTLRRTGWYWRRHTGDGPLSCRARLERSLMDDGDLLAVVLAAAVCGPPGRSGVVAETFKNGTITF